MPDASKRLLQVEVPAAIHQKLKVTAARRQVTMRELVQTAIETAVLNAAYSNRRKAGKPVNHYLT